VEKIAVERERARWLCPRVYQSGERDHRGSLAKNGPKYLRWALIEAATHAVCSPIYRERYQRTAKRLGRQRRRKVARVDIARKLAEAIWYMLTRHEPFAPAGATTPLAARRPPSEMRRRCETPINLVIPPRTR
jgi:transposase